MLALGVTISGALETWHALGRDDAMTRLLEKSPASMDSESEDEVLGATTLEEVRQSVEDYRDYAPESLKDLDPFRYDTLPKTLRKRCEDNNSATSLTKNEVVKLVEWKLFGCPHLLI